MANVNVAMQLEPFIWKFEKTLKWSRSVASSRGKSIQWIHSFKRYLHSTGRSSRASFAGETEAMQVQSGRSK